jgi:hypothetical protein
MSKRHNSNQKITESYKAQQTEIAELRENLDILSRELRKKEWIELTATGNQQDFTLPDRKTIAEWAQIYFIKNPLIGLAVTLKTLFVFGKGITIKADDEIIQDVVDDFWKDDDNKAELTSLQAQQLKSNTLQLDGNIFLTFFVNVSTGHVKVSSIPIEEIGDIIMHPQNRHKALWYKRIYQPQKYDYETGAYVLENSKTEYYRDWKNTDSNDKIYDPPTEKIAKDSAGQEIMVFHLKVNCTDKQKFGFSETYRAHDWAKAYTEFLSDLASIWKTLAIFAAERKMKGGTKGQIKAAAAGTRTYNPAGEKANEKPAAGSTRFANENDTWNPVKTNGVTMKADDGRRLLLMVCAAMGVFEHYFGDGSNSNLASTESMELPMMKMFEARQALWEDAFRQIFTLVIHESAKTSSGNLNPYAEWGNEKDQSGKLTLFDGGEEISQTISVDFPPITTKNVKELIESLKTALTLDGQQMSATPMITSEYAAKEALNVFGADNADEIIEELYAEGAKRIEQNANEGDQVQRIDDELNQLLSGGGSKSNNQESRQSQNPAA